MHSYLPVIYREPRGNRVVLLDGARGSGKSALLVSLLDAYSTALAEQRVPKGYEAWLSPEDRVVPVGLVDLQPLPHSTNLLFHLVANLERVVEAMETRQDAPRLGTAAWHPGGENESHSRKYWRNFVRVAASGWKDNLEARKGTLDAEAFAVEVEQGELQRLDVARSFREFVDALVKDYRVWNHWQSSAPPLFLLAIDDADMNPDHTENLLEMVRKLWHPRLAFLLTGDSELFLSTLSKSRPGLLGSDIYAKVIPLRHRCELRELSLQQRLEKKPPALEKLLMQIPLPVPAHPSRLSGTLADYFKQDSQIQGLLPGRLRALQELGSRLESIITANAGTWPRQMGGEAVAFFWKWSLSTASIAPALRERLEPSVRVDGTTRALVIESTIVCEWSSFELLSELETDQARLNFTRPIRLEASFDESGLRSRQPLDRMVTSAFVLAADFIADAEQYGMTPPKLPSRLSTPLLVASTLDNLLMEGPSKYAWPLPEWEAPIDVTLLGQSWSIHVSGINRSHPDAAEEAVQYFLRTILSVGLGNEGAGSRGDAYSWKDLASDIATAALLRTARSKRQRMLGEWALGRAGILAAPESGLPAPVANALLDALRGSFQKEWEPARQAMREARLERARQTFWKEKQQEPQPREMESFLQRLDQQFPEHQFRRLVEALEDKAAIAESVNSFRQTLEKIQLRTLDRIKGESDSHSLASYLTPLRWTWLQRAPAILLRSALEELKQFTQMQDAGAPALASLWKAGCEAVGVPKFAEILQLQEGQLLISERQRRLLDAKREHAKSRPVSMPLGLMARLRSRVHLIVSAQEPVLSLPPRPSTEHALEAILRMAYDHEKDLGEEARSNDVSPVGWKGMEFRFKSSKPLYPWPVPQWPSLFEWELLEPSWQQAVQLAHNLGTSPKVLDGLAYWLLSACQDLQSRMESYRQFKLELSVADWRALLLAPSRARLRGHEVRPRIYKPWRRLLALMATPEAGLSDTTAIIILGLILKQRDSSEGWDLLTPILNQQKTSPDILAAFNEAASSTDEWARESKQLTPNLLKALRRSRLLDAGVSEEQVDALLTDIDSTFPDHPWVKVFGPWGNAP
jgi:hypothetical protein